MNNKSGSERRDRELTSLMYVPAKLYEDLQKLCEEQERRIEWLMNQPNNSLKARCLSMESQLAHLNLVLEGYKLMAGLSTTDHLKVQGMIEAQLATQTAEIARLNLMIENWSMGKEEWQKENAMFLAENTKLIKENNGLRKGLATQTERTNRLEKALHYFQEHGYSRKVCSEALNQESLVDGGKGE